MDQRVCPPPLNEVEGKAIIEAYIAIVEEQVKQNIEPVQCYGDFSNKSPFANFSNHSEFTRRG